jgi:phosphate transport system substrate-binding protein
MLIYKEQNYSKRSKTQAETTLDLIQFILSDKIQNLAKEVHYAPLPEKVREQCQANLKQVTFDGIQLIK